MPFRPPCWFFPALTNVLITTILSVCLVSQVQFASKPCCALKNTKALNIRYDDPATSVEVVISHYDEDMSWIDRRLSDNNSSNANDTIVRYTIYSKGNHTPPNAIALSNVGRESHTYLHHIIKNYNSLADWTVFSQAAEPVYGVLTGHLCSGVSFDDYLRPRGILGDAAEDDWFMVHTTATFFPNLWHSSRFDMMFHVDDVPSQMCPEYNPNFAFFRWWTKTGHVLRSLPKKQPGCLSPVDFYNQYIVGEATRTYYYQNFTLNYGNGARFGVSRDRIRRRPRSYYQALLEVLSRHINPAEGYYLETMWYDVFHPDRLQAQYGPVCKQSMPTINASDIVTFKLMSAGSRDVMKQIYGHMQQ